MTEHVPSTWRQWLAVSALGVGSFAIVTTELAPVGLLSPIGAELGQSEATVALAVTLYAWIGAAAALASVTLLSGMRRRPLLVSLMALLALSALISGLANSFGMLMAARLAGALAHGAFWAMIGTLGAQIVPPEKVGLATSIIFGGVSAASVLGIPAASFIGGLAGWQTAFLAVAALAALVAVTLRGSVPDLPGQPGISAATLGRIARDGRFVPIFAVTILSIMAHFMAFTFVEPYLATQLAVGPTTIALLLFVFGGAGLLANVLCGALIDRHLKTLLMGALTVSSVALGMLTLPVTSGTPVLAGLCLSAWGGAVAIILVGLQTWILKDAGKDALPASAIYVALFNGAIGLGAALGAAILSVAGMPVLFAVAALLTLACLVALAALETPGVAVEQRG
ncbi:putative MFS family arabinose efflux permease [Rhodovulum imhoffii]|uniref:Putative MFS family arabinose efflux permease n=1 Tax=Rhodovulum imhoffii TaxID=365340 RepID=A0A2T5BQD3_9RHOB|nr:MFS transporter [Rhodovulum imhoffii]MBK5933707.1 MFS transporter [Rhodovulum imhoffii]PTN01309.1 putative MFS family arabinose efflux permease [Rhodovulum imhoffii]